MPITLQRPASAKPRRPVSDGAWVPAAAFLQLAAVAALGVVFRQPWLFPSLGPSAVMHLRRGEARGSALYENLMGHGLGMAAGYAAVFALGAYGAPSVMSTDLLTAPRAAAGVLAVTATAWAQLRARAFHPPGAATTLLIALGAFRPTPEDARALVVGVFTVALAGELMRRWRFSKEGA